MSWFKTDKDLSFREREIANAAYHIFAGFVANAGTHSQMKESAEYSVKLANLIVTELFGPVEEDKNKNG